MIWAKTVGQWAAVPAAAVRDRGQAVIHETTAEALNGLADRLAAMGPISVIGQVDLSVTNSHGFFAPRQVVVLAQVRVLPLLNPNPFPTFRLFGR